MRLPIRLARPVRGPRILAALCLLAPLPSPTLGGPQGTPRQVDAGAPEPGVIYETATVRDRPLDTATGSVTVLDRSFIESTGAATVAELLAGLPGVDSVRSGTRGGLSTLQIRGGDPNFTRVLIDGVAVNDPVYQVGSVFDFEALPASAVERIEIVRGALSSIYGSTGLAGTIHVITRSDAGSASDGPARGGIGGELELTAGNADLLAGRALVSSASDRGHWLVAASTEAEDGRIADESFDARHLQARLGVDLSRRWRLTLAGRAADWRADDYADASGGPLLGDGALRQSDHGEASLGLVLETGGNRGTAGPTGKGWSHRLHASLYRHDLERSTPAIFPLVPAATETTRFRRTRVGVSTSFEVGLGALAEGPGLGGGDEGGRDAEGAADRASGSWRLSLGADIEEEDGRNSSLLRLPPFLGGDVSGNYERRRRTPGVYVEGLVERGTWLFELGLRADWPETSDGADPDRDAEISPRVGLAWRTSERLRLRASWGRAFQLPSFFALASPPALGGNPELRPEVMRGGDVGLELGLGPNASLESSYFVHHYEDLVDFDFGRFTHLNRSRVRARGVESRLVWSRSSRSRIPGWIRGGSVALTWQDVEDQETGGALRHRPEWYGSLRLGLRPAERWRLDLELRGRSSVVDEQIPVPERSTVDGRIVAAARVSWRVASALELEARIENLLDRDYEELIGFPGPGRGGRLALRWRLGER